MKPERGVGRLARPQPDSARCDGALWRAETTPNPFADKGLTGQVRTCRSIVFLPLSQKGQDCCPFADAHKADHGASLN